MPYIKKGKRALYDAEIRKLSDKLTENDHPGHLNYVITKLLHNLYVDEEESYTRYNEAMGVLACVTAEFYRMQVVAYENKKIVENGHI